jgi:hypothetical protein
MAISEILALQVGLVFMVFMFMLVCWGYKKDVYVLKKKISELEGLN